MRNLDPNPGFQENFIKSCKPIRLCTVGNQGGKTHIGCAEHAMYALGEHPHKEIRTPNIGIIVSAQGFKEGIVKTILPKLYEVTGSADIKRIKNNSQGVPTLIEWRSGSVTHLMSAEQDDKVFEGTTFDHAWFDEPVRRSIFVATKRGLMKAEGHLWMTCTPLDEPWIYEEIYIPGVEGKDPDIEVFEGTPDQNRHLSDAAKAGFKKILTEDEMQARWLGKFSHLSGRVFKEYDPNRHFIEPFDIPRHWPVWVSIDPHPRKPHGVLFIAVDPQGIKYACNEIYVDCTIKELAKYIKEVEEQYRVVQRLIDTSSQAEDWGKQSARQLLDREGIRTKLAQKKDKKRSGIILMNQLFKEDELYLFNTCTRFDRELRHQVYKKNKRDSGSVLEEPEKRFDDQTDNARYILIENPRFSGMSKIKRSPWMERGA